MDRNKIIIINELSLEEIDENSIKFIIDGKDIQTIDDYFEAITEKFEFPQFNNQLCNLNGYLDWIRDLSWLEEKFEKFDNISLIIKNYKKAFNGNSNEINYFIIELFIEDILPYWEEERDYKKFNVYLVEKLK